MSTPRAATSSPAEENRSSGSLAKPLTNTESNSGSRSFRRVEVALGSAWLLYNRYVSRPWTRDAQVRANVVEMAPRVSGYLVRVAVQDNQSVQKGDLLFQIDASSYQLAVNQAQVDLDQARADVAALEAAVRAAEATVKQRNAAVDSAQSQVDGAQAAVKSAEAAVQEATSGIVSARAAIAQGRYGGISNYSICLYFP